MERTLPKLSGHLVILALSVAVTLSVRTALKAQYSQERRQIEAQAREKRARQMASAWNALPLTGITTPDFAEASLPGSIWGHFISHRRRSIGCRRGSGKFWSTLETLPWIVTWV